MQPITEAVPRDEEQSFTYRQFELPRFPFDWHLHRELELTWIVAGRGQRYVGDHAEAFGPGDLVLLGSELPHTWCSAPGRGRVASVVIQFPPEFPGPALLALPELAGVGRLLARGSGGLAFSGLAARRAGADMEAMASMTPLERMTALLAVLDRLARARSAQPLASDAFTPGRSATDRRRVDQLHEFIHRRYADPIRLADAAAVVKMNPTSFARFFRRVTGRSFVAYLQHLRVAHACRQLIDSDRRITEVCFLSGFGNLSNFNRVFRRLKGVTPRTYRRRHVEGGHDPDAAALHRHRAARPRRCRVRSFQRTAKQHSTPSIKNGRGKKKKR